MEEHCQPVIKLQPNAKQAAMIQLAQELVKESRRFFCNNFSKKKNKKKKL